METATHKAYRRHWERLIRICPPYGRDQTALGEAIWAQWKLLDMLDAGLIRLTPDFALRTGVTGFKRVADALKMGRTSPLPRSA